MVKKTMRCLSPLSEVMCLGHLASEWGVDTDPGKITALTQMPNPTIRWLLPGACAQLQRHCHALAGTAEEDIGARKKRHTLLA